jgi:hypothetical protein
MVPENLLRLYIEFNAPMSRRTGVNYIHLLDQDGREVVGPFLPLDADFWNADRTRYTVFFDPGRVKQDLLPRRQMGPSLRAGRRYTLVVDAAWTDARGATLKETYRRELQVGRPLTRPVDPRSWTIDPPGAGSREPLVVSFPVPLDHGLLLRTLGVAQGDGEMLVGDIRIEAGERRWLFTPRTPWAPGAHRLVALSILEDVAGNRIGRPFEVDRFDQTDRSAEPERTTVAFTIPPSATR